VLRPVNQENQMTGSHLWKAPIRSAPAIDPVPSPAPNPDNGPNAHRYRAAFERATPAAQALDANDLVTINIDLPSAIATAIGALPKIMTYRDQAATLSGFDVSVFDQLETFTFATGVAHSDYMNASSQPAQIVKLNQAGDGPPHQALCGCGRARNAQPHHRRAHR
jgi:hypothetical protein